MPKRKGKRRATEPSAADSPRAKADKTETSRGSSDASICCYNVAGSLETMDDTLKCTICLHIYQEPVTLQCSHSYCRKCLKQLADKSTACDSSLALYGPEAGSVVSCPQCRVPVRLDWTGVDGLPTNTSMVEDVERRLSVIQQNNKLPLCSACDDDSKEKAVTYCPTCRFLYCEACLRTVHPMRGSFKHHMLISAEEYLRTTSSRSSQSGTSQRIPQCDIHTQPYSIYCVTCRSVLCTQCLVDHDEHVMSAIQAASDKLKAPLIRTTEECEELQIQTKAFHTELDKLEESVEKHDKLKDRETLKTFNGVLAALQSWKTTTLEQDRAKREDWQSRCSSAKAELSMKEEEFDNMVGTARALVSSNPVSILQAQNQVLRRLKDLSSDVRRKSTEIKRKIQSKLDLDPILPKEIYIQTVKGKAIALKDVSGDKIIVEQLPGETTTEKQLTAEELRFTEQSLGKGNTAHTTQDTKPLVKFKRTSHPQLKISYDGFVVKKAGLGGLHCMAWMDYPVDSHSGTLTFRLELNLPPYEENLKLFITLGITEENSDVWIDPGPVRLIYHSSLIEWEVIGRGSVAGNCKQPFNGTHPYCLIFSVNCQTQVMTITEAVSGDVMATRPRIDLSQPAVPAVEFSAYMGLEQKQVSARLLK